jgi:hypothetical protein
MNDNNLRISFDYKYPDDAALVVCNVSGGSYFGNPELHIKKVITGEKAVKLYSELTGKSVEDIRKEAGYTKYDM